MSSAYPILRSLDPHHARIGYLAALVTVATRGLDRQEALTARYQELLFERIFETDNRFEMLLERVGAERRADIHNVMMRTAEEDPSSILSPYIAPPSESLGDPASAAVSTSGGLSLDADQGAEVQKSRSSWLYVSELWLYDARMPSTLGFLSKEKLGRTLDLARWTDVLLPTYELSETGFLLQRLVLESEDVASAAGLNPLASVSRPAITALLLRILLASEYLLPFLLSEMVDRHDGGQPLQTRSEHGLLRLALRRMLSTIGEPDDPADVLSIIELGEFEDSLAKPSTAENYLRPRLEMLVDLGILGRRSGEAGARSKFPWLVTDVTRRMALQLKVLQARDNRTPEFLDSGFIGAIATAMGWKGAPVTRPEERLLWFARAYVSLGREFGFTPGRTLALNACLMALEAGRVMEIEQVFDAVYDAARTSWESYLHYSGGSRFDREFLIRVDAGMVVALERALGQSPGGEETANA